MPTVSIAARVACLAVLGLWSAGAQRVWSADPPAAAAGSPAGSTAAGENELSVLILQSLDQKTRLTVENAAIREALAALSDSTGIPISISDETLSFLPYGSQTMLSARIEDQPLRASLEAILRPAGLRFEVLSDRVEVKPVPPLRRLCRRATWEELELLERLSSGPWSRELGASLPYRFLDMPERDAEANRRILLELADAVGPGPAAEVLELACERHGWTWRPEDGKLTILTRTRQVEDQLNTRVTLRYDRIHLKDALLDLAARAGVLLKMEPGVLAGLPQETVRQFSLSVNNMTICQALEVVAAETGLSYIIEPQGLRIAASPMGYGTAATPEAGDQAMQKTLQDLRTNPIVGQITFPLPGGMQFAFFLREADLPARLNEMRRARIARAAVEIEKALATHPATPD